MPSISDALVVTRRHARVGLLTARCAGRDTLLADGVPCIDLRAEGLCHARPVRVRRTAARERLPSCREPASFHPQAVRALNCLGTTRFRAPFRRLSTRALRQAVLRASSWLAPSSLHEILRSPGAEGARCVQPTSATRTNDVHPSRRMFPVRSSHFRDSGRPAAIRGCHVA